MKLKRLELNGFKSFARTTVLEFPVSTTAIVGPNGSGKSNVSEGIRWVLGEQSMKSLRGKRGEDLIWNGSPTLPRMGKGQVTLIFDNKDGKIPVDFDEVSIGRKIFRDGINEYYLNDSQVRLKDVVELIARMGLGEIKHNMIGQGEVDRILLSTPRERRELIEEAIGLKVYQIKKAEAERKLDASKENLKDVESLIRELTPHLKFLKEQAKKAESRQLVSQELNSLQKYYFQKGFEEIASLFKKFEAERSPYEIKIKAIEEGIQGLFQKIRSLEGKSKDNEEVRGLRSRISQLEKEERELSRDLGRVEGRIEAEKAKPKTITRIIDLGYVKEAVLRFIGFLEESEKDNELESLRQRVATLKENISRFLKDLEKGSVEEERKIESEIEELAGQEKKLQDEMKKISQGLLSAKDALYGKEKDYASLQQELRQSDKLIRDKEEEKTALRESLNRTAFEEEKVMLKQEELEKELVFLGLTREDIGGELDSAINYENLQEARRRIERLRARLEEIGGIDESVVKEYQETEARYTFLQKENEDIKKAIDSTEELLETLEETLKENFHEGFSKIKDEFHNYFRVIFGGGGAKLKLVEYGRKKSVEELQELEGLGEEVEEPYEGIDIEVDLPKKRIKSLAMLSGGERSLCSIAFLFAVTAVNPPPFLFLDETDAALDEANSKRYAEILRELSKKTQLIIVTHNRETMRVAGVLYGITMGDDAVSKLLSLKLEEAEVYTNR